MARASSAAPVTSLLDLAARIEACRACPRLVAWREEVAVTKRASYRAETYWGRAITGFGDPGARLLVVGLAPAAHGGNRTGRVFTGDRSGDWLYAALFRAGLANQPTSTHRDDGLTLRGTWVTAAVRCAPPGNRPAPDERARCAPFLLDELRLLPDARTVVCLGGFAWEGMLRTLATLGHGTARKPVFGHGSEASVGPFTLLGSYHPSQQNTFTGRLTEPMIDAAFATAKRLANL